MRDQRPRSPRQRRLRHRRLRGPDLKPENILISRGGAPWVADLGIAHVNPDFVTVGLQTIESERLLNRDYYAPEQRFGKATAVDHRADIYALGCIFYEMLTSIPPVRTNAPKLSVISRAFEPFEPIWARMTAWEADARYQTLEDALEDLSVSFGWVLASLKGAASLQNPDIPTMVKLLRTSNEAQRQRGVDLAVRLGKSALLDLHELAGHGKRDVRNSCARALGLIGEDSSIPILVAGLYGNSDKPTRFRPSQTSDCGMTQPAPTGLCPKAQGCEARATLGHRPQIISNRKAVAAIPALSTARDICHNLVEVC